MMPRLNWAVELAALGGWEFDPDKPATIYALVDPISQEVQYVGITFHDPRWRFLQHVVGGQASPAKETWLAGLKRTGQRPVLRILEQVSLEGWAAAERRWIADFDALHPLTNSERWLVALRRKRVTLMPAPPDRSER